MHLKPLYTRFGPGMDFDEKTLVLGVGAQKAGTTWLFDYLSKRGDIYMPNKEMHYFNVKHRTDPKPDSLPDLASEDTSVATVKFASYKEFFRERVPADCNHYGEITPAYALIGKRKYRKIRRLFSNIRILFIMRDPLDRFYSQVRMFQEKAESGDKPDRELDWMVDHWKFLDRSRYETTIKALEAVFKKKQIGYFFYETLFQPESIAGLCRFLGVPYMAADFGNMVNARGTRNAHPVVHQELLLDRLASTYRFCREKFGDRVPAQWYSGFDESAPSETRNGPPPDPGGATEAESSLSAISELH